MILRLIQYYSHLANILAVLCDDAADHLAEGSALARLCKPHPSDGK